MKVVCAWCGKDLGLTSGPDDQTSRGVCVECAKEGEGEDEDEDVTIVINLKVAKILQDALHSQGAKMILTDKQYDALFYLQDKIKAREST